MELAMGAVAMLILIIVLVVGIKRSTDLIIEDIKNGKNEEE